MAVHLEATYAKKLGLPNYSSHQYSVTIRTEVNDLAQIEAESARLYRILQDAVDCEIQQVGFMPDASTYGMQPRGNAPNGSNNPNNPNGDPAAWACSDKQRELIQKIVREKGLDKTKVEEMAVELFGVGVKTLNRLQASGLIDELLEQNGGRRRHGNGYHRSRERRASAARGGAE